MSAAPARNWAAMLKEKKAVAPQAAPAKPVVVAPIDAPAKAAEPTPAAAAAAPEAPLTVAAPAELVKAESVATPTAVEAVLSPVSVATPTEAPAPAQVSLGPVSLSKALAKLVKENDFCFAGAVAPRAPPTPVVAAADPPTVATPPAPIATAPTVTSSSELRGTPQWTTQPHHHHQQQHHQQAVYNPPMHYYVPPQSTARPYGGELGSVPRFFNAERHFNAEQHYQAQPYHPTYQTPYHTYRGGYGGQAYNNNPYDNAYPSYYPGQGTPYMGGRLQAQQPYYPPRNYQQQQQ